MIDYIKTNEYTTYLFYEGTRKEYVEREKIIGVICKKYFVDYKKYMVYARRVFDFKYSIPIYLSPSLLLFKIKVKDDTLYINYFNILTILPIKKGTCICFKSGERLCVPLKIEKYLEYEDKAKIICEYFDEVDKVNL